MRAALLIKKQVIRMGTWPDRTPGRGEVRLRLRAVGVCGSDVTYYTKGRIAHQIIEKPQPLGHEPSGEVVSVGPGVKHLKPGMRVYIEPGIDCGKCEFCRRGYPNLCVNMQFLGTPPVAGVFREYLTYPAKNCYPIPNKLSFDEAAMLEPYMVGMTAVEIQARVKPKQTVAILGAGPIGLCTLMCAHRSGAHVVAVTDHYKERLAVAKKLGARNTIRVGEGEHAAEKIRALTKGRGVDVAFECAGKPEALDDVIHSCASAGVAVIAGIVKIDRPEIDIHNARRKELTILNVRRSRANHKEAIRRAASGEANLKALITHRFGLDQVEKALKLVSEYRDGVVKAVIHP